MARKKRLGLSSPGGQSGWLLTLGVLSLLAMGTGGLFGLHMVSTVEKAVDDKNKIAEGKKTPALIYTGDLALRNIAPVVTNLANGDDVWIRLESSIVFTNGALENPDIVVAEIRQDILAYLRTLSITQVQGASGLQHLREDLNERVVLRSKGLVRELVVETLVIQ
ncbi:flagellar basal body-associated FliL family protein [Microvirga rosea]|uniref:flagellar basal body-associated FliL family protein n=1 Tax=Microvirga rosea TaxID=2715425 RepID=UPI001D0A69C9|nr:flagellar basal body-associated FliL family protein [Microvirga rosea]MCB8822595.1 flagellar basal body-associated FliL family protein [Microvirga rosea]